MLPQPVKCIPSVTKTSFILHFLSFAWCCFGIYNDRTFYDLPVFNEYGGRSQHLTMITAYLCLVASGFAFFVDFIQMLTGALESSTPTKSGGYENSSSFLISLRDDLISFWVFTLSTFVVLLYWGIAAIDLEGIHPAEHQKFVPLFGWFNQYLHTIPLFIAFFLISHVNYQYGSFKKVIFFVFLLGTSYLTWMAHLAKVKGYWAYGIIEKQSREEFIVFIILCHVIFFIIHFIGRKVSAIVWNEDYRDKVIIQLEQKSM